MRFVQAAAVAAFLCVAGAALAQQAAPFPPPKGTAMPPPAPSATQSAPPEGAGPHGIDFGQWRGADPASYEPAFRTQIRARYANQEVSYIRTDLEANGFVCEDATRLDCRIEIMEQQCAIDWYVVLERGQAIPIAGFERMCLGAR